MNHFIIVTHALLAEGLKSAAEMIMGRQENVTALCAYTNEQVDFKAGINKIVESRGDGDEIFILTDFLGGSVNGELMPFIKTPHVHVITGTNLVLLLQLLAMLGDAQLPVEEAIDSAMEMARNGIAYCNRFHLNSPDEENF